MEHDVISNEEMDLDNAELAFEEDALSEADAIASVGDPALAPEDALSNDVNANA